MKTLLIISSLLLSIAFSVLFGQSISMVAAHFGAEISPIIPGAAFFVGKIIINLSGFSGALAVGVNKEIWLSELAENFYPAGLWLSRSRDFTPFVENDRINWAAVGADPTIYLNRDTIANPVPIVRRTDTHKYVDLDVLDSENTPVTNVEQYELAYDKMASVVRQHRNSLLKTCLLRAAHAWAPAANAANSPVVGTTGATASAHKRFSALDIAGLKKAFDDNDFDASGRVLLLHSDHLFDLQVQDLELYKALINLRTGEALQFSGFDIYTNASVMPIFNKTALTKNAIGAAAAPSTDSPSTSVAWIESQVVRADGSYDMFMHEKSPEYRADYVGFQKRFVAGSFNSSRATGAIVKVAA